MVNRDDVDHVLYSLEPDYERQRAEVREFWDLQFARRRAYQAHMRRERMIRIVAAGKRTAVILGSILVLAALLYVAACVRGVL